MKALRFTAQALTSVGFKSSVRAGGGAGSSNQGGSPEAEGGSSGSSAQSTTDVMAAKRAAKEAKLRDVTLKLIVSTGSSGRSAGGLSSPLAAS
eukprot:1139779-Pelagomonas_calceolata.AAC.1